MVEILESFQWAAIEATKHCLPKPQLGFSLPVVLQYCPSSLAQFFISLLNDSVGEIMW